MISNKMVGYSPTPPTSMDNNIDLFYERFGGKKLTIEAKINKFLLGSNPEEHISICELEWKRLGVRILSQLFIIGNKVMKPPNRHFINISM
jgi:hypothetical protein